MTDNAPPQTNAIFESVTQKWVRGSFADWYRRYGLGITGYPLTEQFVDAETKLPTQYFQRVALEEVSGQIRLRLLGQESLTRLQELTQQRAETQRLADDVDRGGFAVEVGARGRRSAPGHGQQHRADGREGESHSLHGLHAPCVQRLMAGAMDSAPWALTPM